MRLELQVRERRRLDPEFIAVGRRIVFVLLGRGGRGSQGFVEMYDGRLYSVGRWIDMKGVLANPKPPSCVEEPQLSTDRALDQPKVLSMKAVSIGRGPLLVHELGSEPSLVEFDHLFDRAFVLCLSGKSTPA